MEQSEYKENKDELLSFKQAANLLNVSVSYVEKLINSGQLAIVDKPDFSQNHILKNAVLSYKAEKKLRQAKAIEAVINASQQMGFYDDELAGIPTPPQC